MDAEGFLADLEAKPQSLRGLAEAVDGGLLAQAGPFLDRRFRRYRLIGMGSSSYAAHVAAARMRSLGLDAAAELASSRDGYPMDPDTLVVAISASGATAEVLDALDRLDGHFPVLALTNQAGSPLSGRAGAVLPLTAGTQRGPIACRSFQHTGLLLDGLSIVWSGGLPRMAARDVAVLAGRVADACDHLLSRREEWLPAASALLDGPQEVQVLAPAERISSAQQSALTLRRGPRQAASASESADWWHTAPRPGGGGRSLLFTGSRYDRKVVEHLESRGDRVVAVGAGAPSAAGLIQGTAIVRYPDDERPAIALHTEPLVAELIAAAHPWPA